MIESISISNYALIDTIELNFHPGFNIITGETGAGKSIMLGALSMLLGNRADTRVVTDKEKKSVVEATFNVSRYPQLKGLLIDNDIDWDDTQLILRREISPNGRSRSFINDSPVSLALMRDVAVRLVDLHSQHQNLLLADPSYQLHIIDTLLPDSALKTKYAEAYESYRDALRKYRAAKQTAEQNRADEEFLRYQLEKLDELNLHEGETAELEKQREVLANVNQIKTALRQLIMLFQNDENGITDNLKEAVGIWTQQLMQMPDGESMADRIESLRIEAADILSTIEDADNKLDADPERLFAVEERLSDIYNLQRKHNVDEADELIEIRRAIAEKLDAIDHSDERIKTLAATAKRAKLLATRIAETLTEERKKVAESFGKQLLEDALPLGMNNLVVDIRISPTDLCPSGADNVDFLFSFNKNQPLMPVKDTASGGEISRLMLAVKAIVAGRIQLPSIIFDEIDTGVSGDVANRMGALMKRIAENIQVIAITHLPPVAAQGETHFKVFKEDSDTATNTKVKLLSDSERISELALMLSGNPDDESARETARTLLNKSNNL